MSIWCIDGILTTATTPSQRCPWCVEVPVVQSLSPYEMNTAIRVQILDATDCISHNSLGKGMNPIILPPAMGKQQDRLGSSALVRQLVQEKENSEFKPVKLRLKIDLVSYPARAQGLVNSTTPSHSGPRSNGKCYSTLLSALVREPHCQMQFSIISRAPFFVGVVVIPLLQLQALYSQPYPENLHIQAICTK